MTEYYTHYWKNETWDENAEFNDGLQHVADNKFRDRGVQVGDWIYVVTVKKGILFVAGKLRVDRIVSLAEAIELFGGSVWPAKDHIISDKEYPANFECSIPKSVYPHLQFETAKGPKPPYLIEGGLIYQQSLRGVRRLTGGGARLLDKYMQLC